MSLREAAAPLFECSFGNIQAPIVVVVNVITGANEEAADIAAKIQNFTTLPSRACQCLVEVGELCLPPRDVRFTIILTYRLAVYRETALRVLRALGVLR